MLYFSIGCAYQTIRAPLCARKLGTRELAVQRGASKHLPHCGALNGESSTKLMQAAISSDSSGSQPMMQKLKTNNTMKKVLPLGAMLFFILFNYTILRDTKDVLVVTAPGSGAEIIPYLKTYVNLPAAILFTLLYSSLSNVMNTEKLFYTLTSAFLTFFGLFATVIYPNIGFLHPTMTMDRVIAMTPAFFAPFFGIIRNWSFALFYTLANMWGSVVVSLLFWGFANEIMTVPEAKKYYPIFGLMANVALIFSGQYVKFVSGLRSGLPVGMDPWEYSLKLLMGAVVVSGTAILGIMKYIQSVVLKDPEVELPATRAKKTKTKMSMGESVKFLGSSTYIKDLATLVIAYGMSINIVEVAWKSKLKLAFPDPNTYSAFMGNFSTMTGIVTLCMMVMGRFIFSKFGWGTAALITPITLLTTGIGFFSLTLFPAAFAPLTERFGMTPLMLAVFIGAVQNILSKGAKYSLFDPGKEMAYIPLDQESKTKGKAAIDVIGNPLGKSGGSFIQQILIGVCGSLQAATGYLGISLGVIIAFWLKAARRLDVQFKQKNEDMQKEEWPLADFEKKES